MMNYEEVRELRSEYSRKDTEMRIIKKKMEGVLQFVTDYLEESGIAHYARLKDWFCHDTMFLLFYTHRVGLNDEVMKLSIPSKVWDAGEDTVKDFIRLVHREAVVANLKTRLESARKTAQRYIEEEQDIRAELDRIKEAQL